LAAFVGLAFRLNQDRIELIPFQTFCSTGNIDQITKLSRLSAKVMICIWFSLYVLFILKNEIHT
jgi:hypothetical protein